MHRVNLKLSVWTGCFAATLAIFVVSLAHAAAQPPQAQGQTAPAAAQAIGAIKSIAGTTLILTPDKGADVTVAVQPAARIVQVAPGQTDLKNAAAIQLSDLQVGDRIMARGKASDDTKGIAATVIIAIKKSDLEAKKRADQADWQKRGVGGLVSAVDPASGVITISVAGPAGIKPLAIDTTKSTVLRRYAPDSVQFDDAKPSTFDQIRAGDQLRARGTLSADGASFAAEEIVSGSFRNISGTINSVDAANGSVNVTDLITKKPVVVKITSQSKVVKIPVQAAQGIAARLKNLKNSAGPGGDRQPPADGAAPGQTQGGQGGGARGNADLQQIVARLPAAPLTDFMKGDAVMIVSTTSASSDGITAITVVGGVEPILAAPSGQQAVMNLAPWSLGGGEAGGGAE